MHEAEATILLADPRETTAEEASLLADQILTVDEQQRTARFVRQEDRHDHVVSRALVRLALSARFPVEPAAWRFERDDRQKPFIVAPGGLPAFQFSLSHTRGLVAFLVTAATAAGLDVEHVDRRNDLALVATRVCAPTELEALNRLARDAWRERFFQLWTLKEAYAKARGLGLALPLNQLAFEIEESGEVRARFGREIEDDPAKWQMLLQRVSANHVLAAALQRGPTSRFEWKLQRVRVTVTGEKPSLETVR